jgi:DNA modification methylase
LDGGLITTLHGDCRDLLPTLPDRSVQCCVTSPPYYGLRDYGVTGQLGLEPTPDAYIAALVCVFREVRRVLRDDGTLWLNLGDSYNGGGVGGGTAKGATLVGSSNRRRQGDDRKTLNAAGLASKQLLMMPARVALALQADGWWLRSAIVWHKPNPMPESVRDRPTSAYEMVYLLTKTAAYYYDADAVREAHADVNRPNGFVGRDGIGGAYENQGRNGHPVSLTKHRNYNPAGRNCRNVWTITPKPYKGAHFATFPPELAARCIKAGSKPGDPILDPFSGAGTTALVADQLGRNALQIELNAAYIALAEQRAAPPPAKPARAPKPVRPPPRPPQPMPLFEWAAA